MSDTNMLALAVETYQRLFPEIKQRIRKEPDLSPAKTQVVPIPRIDEILDMIQPLPPQTCLIGTCADGVPFLLNLTGMETGSLLVTGDPGCGKTHHLQVMAESTIHINSPHEVQIAVITRDPDEWASLLKKPGYSRHFSGVYGWFEQGATDLINQLVTLGESRGSGRHPGATVLLLVDDLPDIFEADYEIQNGLHWLLENGLFSGIRVAASMDARFCPTNPFWVDTFRTFLIGKIESDATAQSLGLDGVGSTKDLMPQVEFSAYTGENWSKYRLPVN